MSTQNSGGRIACVSLVPFVHQHFQSSALTQRRVDSNCTSSQNTHTAYAHTHKHTRARSHAAWADMTFHFSIKDSAIFFFPPLPARSALRPCRESLGSAHNAQSTNKHTHLPALTSSHSDWGLHTHACMHAIMTVSIIIICRALPEARKALLNR